MKKINLSFVLLMAILVSINPFANATSDCHEFYDPLVKRTQLIKTIANGNLKYPQVSNGTITLIFGRILSTLRPGNRLSMQTITKSPEKEEIHEMMDQMQKAHTAFGIKIDTSGELPEMITMYQNLVPARLAMLIDKLDTKKPIFGDGFEAEWGYVGRFPVVKMDLIKVAKKIDDYFANLDANSLKFWAEMGNHLLDQINSNAEIQAMFKEFRTSFKTQTSTREKREEFKTLFNSKMYDFLLSKYSKTIADAIYTALYL